MKRLGFGTRGRIARIGGGGGLVGFEQSGTGYCGRGRGSRSVNHLRFVFNNIALFAVKRACQQVPIVGQRQCRAAYRRYMITDNMFCAGYKDGRSDTCSGDSGGPLLCRMRGRWTVVGVTSFGDGCGRRGKYGIYASVANHVRWIAAAVATADPSG